MQTPTSFLGFRFIKVPPTQHVIHYSKGRVRRTGAGLAFWYFAPYATLVSIPTGSTEIAFIFEETTADFQTVTLQGTVTYRVSDPARLAQLLDFTLRTDGTGYRTDDPDKLPQRVSNAVQVRAKVELQSRPLHDALRSGDAIALAVRTGLEQSPELAALGLTILSLSVLAIKPTPETARAIEAETREALLRKADEATYARRNSAVEQERAIRENELRTDQVVQEREQELKAQEMRARIGLEEQNRELVVLAAENARQEADAKAYGVQHLFAALMGADPRVLQAVASSGMEPDQLIAQAFQDLAARAGTIGQLNITPDLLQNLMGHTSSNGRKR